ncbi:NAD-dependent malic enzyme [hydrothermal vent metagenome]|uniref:NAD-dependent malic enzyme n=1 Tax=hydrothermal vent metagenome TaxID=652676 RepID=A0A3B1CEE4_9ZZZZ
MSHYQIKHDENNNPIFEIDQAGSDILHNPLLNKGTAFTADERKEFGLNGLLPPHVSTQEEQLNRVYENFLSKPNNIERYVFLRALQDRNETLFYMLVSSHLDEMTPVIYTPTVGEAVQAGSHIYRHTRGLYVSPENVDMMDNMAKCLPSQDIDVIVVTDNQGILGIGDQGVGGMGIPIGKLSLYTLGAGIAPSACLPICLDVGTDNEALLDDPLYLGQKQRRLDGDQYNEFIDSFVSQIKKLYPKVLLQWEDFSKQNAFSNLDRYREKILSFNDDIQGTGAVALAGILGAMKVKGEKFDHQRYCVFGAGAGGIGVARQILNALTTAGLSLKEAKNKIMVVDSRGLITVGRDGMEEYKASLATDRDFVKEWNVENPDRITLEEVIVNGGITVLLGLSGQPGRFTKRIAEAMAQNTPMPVIFPLSNPTSKVEAQPKDIYEWTKGRAIVATGSPFADVSFEGRTYRIGQGNNVFIFPGVGLGALAAGAEIITDRMFTAAAHRLSDFTPSDYRETHCVFPRVAELADVSRKVALAVFEAAVEEGVATVSKDIDPNEAIERRFWKPEYSIYRRSKKASL